MENNNEIDLDFTQPGSLDGVEVNEINTSEKIADLDEKINRARKLINIAEQAGDTESVARAKILIQGFEATKNQLNADLELFAIEPNTKKDANVVEIEDAFSQAVGREYGGSLDKMQKRGGL